MDKQGNCTEKILKYLFLPFSLQQAIVAEIEAEKSLVAANHALVEHFEEKIKVTVRQVWGKSQSKLTQK